MNQTDYLLEMSDVQKAFGGVRALQGASLNVKRGTCHGLLGENGAGKSTLMKVLTGVISKDSGNIKLNGNTIEVHSIHQAEQHGIAIVPQELSFVSYFDVAENIFYGVEPTRTFPRFIKWKTLYDDCERTLATLKIDLPSKTLASKLNVSQQQMMVIARVLTKNADLIIMDEPTARLGHEEVTHLLEYIQYLKSCGKTIIYISHRLEEIFEICDDVTVMRDGKTVCEAPITDLDVDKLITLMVNRKTRTGQSYVRSHELGNVFFSVKKLCKAGVCNNVEFSVRQGEVLGMFGLVGAGRTEAIRAILGVDKYDSAEIQLNGKPIVFKNMQHALENGIALIPEERRKQGILPNTAIFKNASLSNLTALSRFGIISKKREKIYAESVLKKLHVVFGSMAQVAGSLSGGNQQKVVISKYIDRNIKLLIMDEPTRGIDVGAKDQIYEIINGLVQEGMTVIIISSEIPELQLLCDRICVMNQGVIMKTFERGEFANSDDILREAIGI